MKFIAQEKILKGWSDDQKYCVTDEAGVKYLLRVSDIKKADEKKAEFCMMERVAALGVPMCKPLEFGIGDEGVYSLQSWIDGEDAEDVIPSLFESAQYAYGLEAGRILKKIHSIPAPAKQEDWESRFNRKMNYKIQKYIECPIKHENGQAFIDYINENRHLLKNRPQVYQHGDYHIGNMMIDKSGKLQIIDFNRNDYGDPWEEFNRIVWCAQKAPIFASGMVNGYFDDQVPMEFWRLLALYISSNTLSSVYWAIPFGQAEVDTMLKQGRDILSWYDNMKNPVPTWYCKEYCLQYVDGIPFKMKREFDFGFLKEYGTVFKVFDDQDSGNICFGTEKDGQRYFLKFAGALTERYAGDPEDAVERLRATVPIYRDLRHESLIELLETKEVGGGFLMVFRWARGDCKGRTYPASHKRFMALPREDRLAVFRSVADFFALVAEKNYVAVDFYDGSILYDFTTGKTTVCDVDLFAKQPFLNPMERLWGSSSFQAPEEFCKGAVIDEITNVYTLGATAFALFGGYERTREAWELSEELFEVAVKAVSAERSLRQQSIEQFREEWEKAISVENR